MTFNVLAVCATGETGDHPYYPLLDDDVLVVPEALDGPLGPPLRVSKVVERRKIGNKFSTVQSVELDLQVWVTGSRVVFYCKKFEKGGTWVGFGLGGLAVAAVATGVSHAVAAGRRKGKALVGHVRYPWISQVMFRPANGRTRGEIRLSYVDGTDPTRPVCDITFSVERSVDPNLLARHITDRIIAYRYASNEEMSPEEVASFEVLRLSGLQAPPQKGYLSSYAIPTSFRVPGGLDPAPGAVPQLPVAPYGTPALQAPAIVPADARRFCTICGSPELGANFCTDCGAAVG